MRNAQFMFRATIKNVQLSKAKSYMRSRYPFGDEQYYFIGHYCLERVAQVAETPKTALVR